MQLSVVVPVYNKEAFLDECIESIIGQTKKDIEIILIDDGSKDKSGAICDKWGEKDRRIKVYHQENKGGMITRKIGAEYATSEYVTFADADDFVDQRSYALADEYMDRGIDIICYGIVSFSSGFSTKRYECFEPGVYSKEKLRETIFPNLLYGVEGKALNSSICNKIFKRELLLRTTNKLPNKRVIMADDAVILYPAVYNADSMAVCKEAYYYYRKRKITETAPYYDDESYLDQIYDVYSYLRDCFSEEKRLLIQNEQLYMQFILERQNRYSIMAEGFRHVFPFDKIEKGERIILYGAGRVGVDYYYQLKRVPYCTVVKWVDKRYMDYQKYDEFEILPRESLHNSDYDKIVIAAKNSELINEMRLFLKSMDVEEERIIAAYSN